MTSLLINDLERSEELDQRARKAVFGGASAGQGIGNGGVMGISAVKGGNILSPTVNVQTIISTPVNVQVANILKYFTAIDTTTIVASAVEGLKI